MFFSSRAFANNEGRKYEIYRDIVTDFRKAGGYFCVHVCVRMGIYLEILKMFHAILCFPELFSWFSGHTYCSLCI